LGTQKIKNFPALLDFPSADFEAVLLYSFSNTASVQVVALQEKFGFLRLFRREEDDGFKEKSIATCIMICALLLDDQTFCVFI